jgi:hypothetical protein
MLKKYMLPAFLVLALLPACNPQLSPEEVITKAIDAINELQTYRFEMTSTITMDRETSQGSIQGEFVFPDRLHMTTVSDGGTEEGIRIGQTEYIRWSVSDDWEVSEWRTAISSVRNNLALSTVEMLDSLVGMVKLPDEINDVVSCFHYKGIIDTKAEMEEQIANLDSTEPYYEERVQAIEQQPRSEQIVEFWVGKEDYLLRQMDIQMVYTEDEGRDTEREVSISANYSIRFYDFNHPITIEPPVVE